MPQEPVVKNAIAFVDGQNLYGAVKHAFGYTFPNYEISRLTTAVCAMKGWTLGKICFYMGIPDSSDNLFWHNFWTRKLAIMESRDIHVYTRKLKYRNQTFKLPDGTQHSILVEQEKG